MANNHNMNPYEVLGIERSASNNEIKEAYHTLALKYHPDRVQGDDHAKTAASNKFAQVSHAYESLINSGAPPVSTSKSSSLSSNECTEQQDSDDLDAVLSDLAQQGPLGRAAAQAASAYIKRHSFEFTNPQDLFEQTFGQEHAAFVRSADPLEGLDASLAGDYASTYEKIEDPISGGTKYITRTLTRMPLFGTWASISETTMYPGGRIETRCRTFRVKKRKRPRQLLRYMFPFLLKNSPNDTREGILPAASQFEAIAGSPAAEACSEPRNAIRASTPSDGDLVVSVNDDKDSNSRQHCVVS